MTRKTKKKRPAFVAQLSEVSRARLRGTKRKRKATKRQEHDAGKVLEEVKARWIFEIDSKT